MYGQPIYSPMGKRVSNLATLQQASGPGWSHNCCSWLGEHISKDRNLLKAHCAEDNKQLSMSANAGSTSPLSQPQ